MAKALSSAGRQSRRQLLKLIRQAGPISRADLSARSGLTRPTVSAIVNELTAARLVREIGKGESTGGKRPIMLELAAERHCAIGIDLGGDFVIRGVLVDLNGQVLQAAEIEFANHFTAIVAALAELVQLLAGSLPPGFLRGVGITVSGRVDTVANEVIASRSLDVVQRQLAGTLQEKVGVPVRLENRPTAAALAERTGGRDFRNMLILTSGRGIGVGIVLDGKLYRGSNGLAGELGSMELFFADADTAMAPLEAWLRPEALTAAVSRSKQRPVSYPEFLRFLSEGDDDATALTIKAADTLAYAVCWGVGLLDPEAVILSGQLLELGNLFLNRFREKLRQSAGKPELQVLPSILRDYGLSPGSAAVILERIFDLKPIGKDIPGGFS